MCSFLSVTLVCPPIGPPGMVLPAEHKKPLEKRLASSLSLKSVIFAHLQNIYNQIYEPVT